MITKRQGYLDRQEGDYYKASGSYWGAVYLEGKWQAYKCLYCLQVLGLAKRKVQPTYWAQVTATRRPADIPHTQEVHDQWPEWKQGRKA